MSTQPVFAADYVESRSRLTTFFRWLLAIPHMIVVSLYGMAAAVAILVAWFALVITGRWPRALYDFVAGYQRYATKLYGYVALLTDAYPPFSGAVDDYPVRLVVPEPKERYSRAKAFFRCVLAIPVVIVLYAMQIVWEVGTLLAWFAIVILGRQPSGLQDMTVLGLSYQQRAYCYLMLLTEDWPPFTGPETGAGGGPGGGEGGAPPAVDTPPPSATAGM